MAEKIVILAGGASIAIWLTKADFPIEIAAILLPILIIFNHKYQ